MESNVCGSDPRVTKQNSDECATGGRDVEKQDWDEQVCVLSHAFTNPAKYTHKTLQEYLYKPLTTSHLRRRPCL